RPGSKGMQKPLCHLALSVEAPPVVVIGFGWHLASPERENTDGSPLRADPSQSIEGLPNLCADRLRADHRVAVLRPVRLRELRHVRERAIDAEMPRRVRVGVDLDLHRLVAHVLAPDLRPRQEEAL